MSHIGGLRTAWPANSIHIKHDAVASKQKAARSDSENESDSPRPKKQTKKTGDSTQAKIDRYVSHCDLDASFAHKQTRSLLSEGLSEDSDSDVVAVSPVKNNNKRRSRSRSITPPPALPRLKLQEARDIVRYVSILIQLI